MATKSPPCRWLWSFGIFCWSNKVQKLDTWESIAGLFFFGLPVAISAEISSVKNAEEFWDMTIVECKNIVALNSKIDGKRVSKLFVVKGKSIEELLLCEWVSVQEIMGGSARARKELLVPPNMGEMDAAALTVATGECTFLLGKPKSNDGSCCCRDKLLHTILHKLPDPFPMAVKPYTSGPEPAKNVAMITSCRSNKRPSSSSSSSSFGTILGAPAACSEMRDNNKHKCFLSEMS